MLHLKGYPTTKCSLVRHFKPLMYITGSVIFASCYIYFDTVILGFLTNDRNVGIYAAGIKMSRIFSAIIPTVSFAVIPKISYFANTEQKKSFINLSEMSLHIILLFTVPLACFLFIFAPELINLLAGTLFTESVPILKITAFIIPVIGLTHFLGMQILFPSGHEKQVIISNAIAAIVSIVCFLILIPVYSNIGAAITILLAECIVLIYQLIVTIQYIRQIKLLRICLHYLLGGSFYLGIAAVFHAFINANPFSILMSFLACGIFYLGTLFLLKNYIIRYFISMFSEKYRI